MPRKLFLYAFVLSLIGVLALPAVAQTNVPRVAFVNASGQLVVSSADAAQRWIITNPGETLAANPGFSWSPDGQRLFYAIQQDGGLSLRLGDVASQSSTEIARVTGNISGGDWLPDGRILLAGVNLSDNNAVLSLENGQLIAPAMEQGPGISRSAAPDGSAIFYRSSNGNYALFIPGVAEIPLPLSNDIQAAASGLWASNAPLVAYWGLGSDGRNALAVSESRSGTTVLLPGANTPLTPLAWLDGRNNLIYRDASSQIRLADMSCLLSSCNSNPLEAGILLLPASAMDVQSVGDWVFFKEGETVQALSLACTGANNCLESAISLGQQAAPRTRLHVVGQTLSYTAYSSNPLDPADRDVRVLNLNCLPNCEAPRSILAGAVGGAIAANGSTMLVDIAGGGLHLLNLNQLSTTYLSGPYRETGISLQRARWN